MNHSQICSQHSQCTICFEDIDCDKNKAVMDCGHAFHFKCIFKWNFTEQGNSCPLCRCSLGLPEDINFESDDDNDTQLEHPHTMFEYSDYEDEEDYDEDNAENDGDSIVDEIEDLLDDCLLDSEDGGEESTPIDVTEFEADDEATDNSDPELDNSESESESESDDDEDFLIETTSIFNNLFEKIDNNGDQFMRLKISCKDCEQQVVPCDFCSTPFCACASTKEKLQGRACPFNKFYRSSFDSKAGDKELAKLLNISETEEKILGQSRICGKCFANRDIILKATMETLLNDEFGLVNWQRANSTFREPEIKSIYYHLFYDNSTMDNTKLYSKYPSYSSYKLFKEAASLKLNIEANNVSRLFTVDSEQLLEDNFGELSFDRTSRSNRSAQMIEEERIVLSNND